MLYFTSIDQNPSLETEEALDEYNIGADEDNPFLNPYVREYYWTPNEGTVSTKFFSIEDILLECSLLDLTRIIHSVEVITEGV